MPSIQGLVYKDLKDLEIEELKEEAATIIFSARSFLPFYPFRSRITITPTRVNITIPNLFTKEEYPIPIDNISAARVFQSIFFASLMLETFRYDTPPPVKFLRKRDAILARRYIQGLVDCKKNSVNITEYPLSELKEKLLSIGKVER